MAALSMSKQQLKDSKVLLIGVRDEKERQTVGIWIKEMGLDGCVELIDFIPRSVLIKKLAEVDLFVYPAFRDSGSMAVLEACALGCPSIAFDAGGQDAFPDDVIVKVKIGESLEDTVTAFSDQLVWAYQNQNRLKEFGMRAKAFAFSKMTWEYKAKQITEIYNEVIK